MFDKSLIESGKNPGDRGGLVTTGLSFLIHGLVLAGVVAAGIYVKENPEVIEKPIEAFVVTQAPPPPPPPPPASSSSSTPRTTPVERPKQEFRQPTETPVNVPEPEDSGAERDEVVEGGVVGGVEGGVVGGVVGGVLGGTLGGTGTTLESPQRVGGDVKAPVAISRAQPIYPELARRSRTEGIVIVEAIIDRQGSVTDVRVLKGLPFGLDVAATDAVKKWKFKPGTLNGRPIPVIFTLTVKFEVNN